MRVVLASLCLIAFAAPAAAQQQATTPDALAQVYACAAQADGAARLACYDAAVGRLQTEQTSGNIVAVDRAQIETIERESFGFSLPSVPNIFRSGDRENNNAADEADLTIERVSLGGDGRTTFYMNNGQVWAQTESLNARLARAGGTVTVRRGALGSYMMSVHAGGPAIRVRRVQ